MSAVPNLGTIADRIESELLAVVDIDGEELTYGALRERARALARGIAARGLPEGSRLAILSLNRADYITVMLASALCGHVLVPLNIKLSADTLRAIIDSAGIALAFVENAFRPIVPDGVDVVDLDQDLDGMLDPGPFDPAAVAAATVSMQPYTSGSTGFPKGVLLTHGGQNWAARTLAEHRRLGPEDRAIIAAPLYHKNAIVAVKTALVSGGAMIVMPRFEADAYARAIEHFGVTMLTGVPTMMRLLLDSPDLPPTSAREKVRVVSMGSSPASDRLLADIRAAFPNAEIHQNYGTTEGGPIMFGWYHPDGLPRPSASIGYPIPGCEWRLEGGEDEGELWVRNPGVALGYHERPDATSERFIDGWYKTGDVLRRDREGWFYFIARTDDMINSGGENVFPQEVEALLERHPAVRAASVIGVDHEIKGQVPVAFVVIEEGQQAGEGELKRFTLENGPTYAHPRRIAFLSKLPLGSTNKIDKAALRAEYDRLPPANEGR